MKFVKFCAAAVAVFLAAGCDGSTSKEPVEQLKIETTPVGPMVFGRQIPVSEFAKYRADFTFKLGKYPATDGEHLAFGIGNVYPALEIPGRTAQGHGFIIGQWLGCPDWDVVFALESFASGGVDSSTCYGPILPDQEYRVELELAHGRWVKARLFIGNAPMPVFTAKKEAPVGVPEDYPVGFFLVPINHQLGSGPYELKNLKVFTQ